MAISTTLAPVEVSDMLGEQSFTSRVCFGIHNSMHNFSTRDINGLSNRTSLDNFTAQMGKINYWPHCNMVDIESHLLDTADVLNSCSMYKDMFTITSANSVEVNLREHAADKVFTGLMTFRSYLNCEYDSMDFLSKGVDDKEEWLFRRRVGLALALAGVSRDFFGEINFDRVNDSTDESTSIYLPNDLPAFAFLPIICNTDEFSTDVWLQNKFGEGTNTSGYIRDHDRTTLRRIARNRNQNPDMYSSMSTFLQVWSKSTGWKRSSLDEKVSNISVSGFLERVESRCGSDMESNKETIISLFKELVEYYND